MKRVIPIVIILGALLLPAPTVGADQFNLPPGKWWENDRLIHELQLTPGQQQSIADLVFGHATRMIDLNANLEKAMLTLENQVQQEPFEPETVRKAFATFQDARRRLETERFEMLLSVRQELTLEQWQRLVTLRERLERIRRDRKHPPNPSPRKKPRGGPATYGDQSAGGPRPVR